MSQKICFRVFELSATAGSVHELVECVLFLPAGDDEESSLLLTEERALQADALARLIQNQKRALPKKKGKKVVTSVNACFD